MHWMLHVQESRDNDFYISYCPALDIMVQGDTAEESIENMDAALGLFLTHASFDEVMSYLILIPPVESAPPTSSESKQGAISAREIVSLAYA